MPTISECIFTISEVTYFSLQNSDFFTTLHLESRGVGMHIYYAPIGREKLGQSMDTRCRLANFTLVEHILFFSHTLSEKCHFRSRLKNAKVVFSALVW